MLTWLVCLVLVLNFVDILIFALPLSKKKNKIKIVILIISIVLSLVLLGYSIVQNIDFLFKIQFFAVMSIVFSVMLIFIVLKYKDDYRRVSFKVSIMLSIVSLFFGNSISKIFIYEDTDIKSFYTESVELSAIDNDIYAILSNNENDCCITYKDALTKKLVSIEVKKNDLLQYINFSEKAELEIESIYLVKSNALGKTKEELKTKKYILLVPAQHCIIE